MSGQPPDHRRGGDPAPSDALSTLRRWLALDSLEEICTRAFPVLQEHMGVESLVVVELHGRRVVRWSGHVGETADPTMIQQIEEVIGRGSAESRDGLAGSQTAATADIPEILSATGLNHLQRLQSGSATIFDIGWRGAPHVPDDAHGYWRSFELSLENLARRDALLELSHIDPVTRVYNRRHFNQRIHEEMQRAKRYGRPLSLLLLDLDRFKLLNDTHGHQAGDIILRYIGQSIRRSVRAIDILCRIGGDEFAVLMPDTDMDSCCALAERLRDLTSTRSITVGPAGSSVTVSASVGAATFPRHADSPERVLWCADMALLAAKHAGGARSAYFDPALHSTGCARDGESERHSDATRKQTDRTQSS